MVPLLTIKQQNAISVLQKHIICCLGNVGMRTHCMPLYKRLDILTVRDILNLENIKLAYHLTHKVCAKPLINLYHIIDKDYDMHGSNVIIPKHKLAIVNKSFICKPLAEWQNVPNVLKSANNVKSFGKSVKKAMLSKY